MLDVYCVACHGEGIARGRLRLDGLDTAPDRLRDATLWSSILQNVRSGLMPPADQLQPSDDERRALERWIKFDAFGIDPDHLDPGRVPLRRLNRAEYRNTIRDLMGVDFDTDQAFPPDDAGHGFDNMADVLTVSPLLLEKYLGAAEVIVGKAVPVVSRVIAETRIDGRQFRRTGNAAGGDRPELLSYYEPASASATFRAESPGHYRLTLEFAGTESSAYAADYNRCRVAFRVDGRPLMTVEFGRFAGPPFRRDFDVDWDAGDHVLSLDIQPLTPGEVRLRDLAIRIDAVTVAGPAESRFQVRPANYDRFFAGDAPEDPEGRRAYARELIGRFGRKAFRRPVDAETLDRLVALAEREWSQKGRTFEAGIARAITVVLASPRFLFRQEVPGADAQGRYPLVDEFTLASRLSYFLWSSTPDEELLRLAEAGTLREHWPDQVTRLLADPRSGAFVENFVGQWLHIRDVSSVPIDSFAVIHRDQPKDPDADRSGGRWDRLNRRPVDSLTDAERRERDAARATYFRSFRRFREPALDDGLRLAMRRETEMLFARVVREDRDLRELLDGRVTFLNGRLAQHYGIDGVVGDEMRLVDLPPDSPRGGVLTQGAVLAVTSNPDRTSPVKRGLFILDNILGMPAPPQPPNIPALEESEKAFKGRTPTVREVLELHRKQPSCRSCHDRIDPLGFALENFDALGRWRDREQENPVDPSGRLVTGEPFLDIRELKRLLTNDRQRLFYRSVSEKMLTYALGRGLTHLDVEEVDRLVDRLESEGGRAGALIAGILDSVPFQRCRRPSEFGVTVAAPRSQP